MCVFSTCMTWAKYSDVTAARRCWLQGMHFTERTRPPPPLTRTELSISTAFHDLAQLRQPWGPALDYAFLSPIYDSISKADHKAASFGWGDLAAAVGACSTPIVALGGVQAMHMRDLRACGFAGAAVIGSVWQATEPLDAYRKLQRAWEAAEITSLLNCPADTAAEGSRGEHRNRQGMNLFEK